MDRMSNPTPPGPSTAWAAAGPGNGSGRKWAQRAEGDRRARSRLRLIESEGVIVLNERRIPGSRDHITMIAVSPAGVFVVDAKHYKGLVHTRRSGPMPALGPQELHVGRRDCTPYIQQVAQHMQAVRSILGQEEWGDAVPVQAMLCLTRAAWGFASPLQISDVWVGWPQLAAGRVRSPGVMDSPAVQEVSSLLAAHLPTR
jgi:hypothetical protein